MENVQEQAENGGQTVTLSVLDRIIQEGRMARDELQQTYARDMLEELATQILDEGMAIGSDTVAMINHRIAQIDELISGQLNEVLHHPDVQKLEASWRGLHQFVMNTETSTRLKLRLLNVSRKELQDDLEKAVEFDQSTLFKKLYEDEYGTFGGIPIACWSVISSLAVIRRMWRYWKNFPRSRRPRMRRLSPLPVLVCLIWDRFSS